MISLQKLLFEQSNSQVELIQQKLVDAGYYIGTSGVDGILGKNTLAALEKYKNDKVTNAAKATDPEVLKSLTGQDINLSSQLTQQGSGTSDFETFKQKLASTLGIELTNEKSKFFDAWRAVENTKASNNPFATTLNYKKDPGMTKFNLANSGQGVKNFSTLDYGVDATAITMSLRYYSSLIEKLKNDNISAAELAKDPSLDKWGTGSAKIQRVLGSQGIGGTPAEPNTSNTNKTEITTDEVKRNAEGWIISNKKTIIGRLASPRRDKVTIWEDITDYEDINRYTGDVDTSVFNVEVNWYKGNPDFEIKDMKTITVPEIRSVSGRVDKSSGNQYTYAYITGSGYKGWVQTNHINTKLKK